MVKKLNPDQIKDHRQRGFHFNERWTSGHVCRKLHMYFVHEGEEVEPELEAAEESEITEESPSPETLFHEHSGNIVP